MEPNFDAGSENIHQNNSNNPLSIANPTGGMGSENNSNSEKFFLPPELPLEIPVAHNDAKGLVQSSLDNPSNPNNPNDPDNPSNNNRGGEGNERRHGNAHGLGGAGENRGWNEQFQRIVALPSHTPLLKRARISKLQVTPGYQHIRDIDGLLMV